MRFRFCGDLDCPDWVLAQIQNLSKLTSIKLKLMVSEIIKGIAANQLKYDKVSDLASTAKFDEGDVRAASSAIEFIITTSAKYDVTGDTLSDELQQLGLPKEHATSLSKVYSDKLGEVRQNLRDNSFRESRLKEVTWSVSQEIIGDALKANIPVAEVDITLERNKAQEFHQVVLTNDKLTALISELKQVRLLMEDTQ